MVAPAPKPEPRFHPVPKVPVKVPTPTYVLSNLLQDLARRDHLMVQLDDKMYALDGPTLLTDQQGNPQAYVFESRLLGEVGL